MEHDKQRQLWDEEHRKPTALKAMDSHDPSNSVQKFWQFLVEGSYARAHGIEMGCGKGRNVIWLAKRGATMEGFDFSEVAIAEAKRRAEGINGVSLQVADATHGWPYESNYFDFGIDCFASTDIESSVGRTFALTEMKRVLKPGGLYMTYVSSTEDGYHKEMIQKAPAGERNTFLQPTGKFEKVFDEQDIAEAFVNWQVIRQERIEKTTEFFGKEYAMRHFWLLLQKPLA